MKGKIMNYFEPVSKENLPQKSKDILDKIESNYGFLPNVFLSMAHSPQLLKSYTEMDEKFKTTDGLTTEEKNLVLLSVSTENRSHFWSAVHSTVLRNQTELSDKVIDAVRNHETVPDKKLHALVNFTRAMTTSRGQPAKETFQAFLDAGYSKQNVSEIVLAIGMKTLTNYSNSLFNTPLNEQFSSEKWEPSSSQQAA